MSSILECSKAFRFLSFSDFYVFQLFLLIRTFEFHQLIVGAKGIYFYFSILVVLVVCSFNLQLSSFHPRVLVHV